MFNLSEEWILNDLREKVSARKERYQNNKTRYNFAKYQQAVKTLEYWKQEFSKPKT